MKHDELHGNLIPEFKNVSLFIFSPTSAFRKQCIALSYDKRFSNFIIACILINCIFLAAVNPVCQTYASLEEIQEKCTAAEYDMIIAADVAGWVFSIIFTIEAIIKTIAMGFFFGSKDCYLKDGWNWLDFSVVIIAWVAKLPGVSNLSALRTFRVLRPLRTLSTIPGMKTIIKSVLGSCKNLFNVLMLWVFMFLLFGIIGLQLFSGIFAGRCYFIHNNAVNLTDLALVGANKETNAYIDGIPMYELDTVDESLCQLQLSSAVKCDTATSTCKPVDGGRICEPVYYGPAWSKNPETLLSNRMCRRAPNSEKPNYGITNFDNIGNGVLTVFTSITLEGWTDVMYNLLDSFGRGYIVIPYFIALILFGSFFLVNLALAVIWQEYEKTSREEKEHDQLKMMARNARESEEEKKTRLAKENITHDPVPCCKACLPMTELVQHPYFEAFITFFIVLNTVTLALDMHPMPDGLEPVLVVTNYVFTVIFLLEMIFKLVGLGINNYVRDGFNLFDAFVVFVSLIEIIIAISGSGENSGLSVFRTFRLFRVFKLIRSWGSLRSLMITILNSLAKVSTAAVLLLIIMFIFTLLGMQLFAGKLTEENFDGEKPRAHFDNFWWGFVTVFQVLTGENWNEVLFDGIKVTGFASVAYFLALTFLGNYVIFNLFLAILLDQFDQEEEEEEEKEKCEHELKKEKSQSKVHPATSSSSSEEGTGSSDEKTDRPKEILVATSTQSATITPKKSAKVAPATPVSNSDRPKRKNSTPSLRDIGIPDGSSLFIFKKSNPFRQNVFQLVSHPYFDYFILFLILISSIMLVVDEPPLRACTTDGCNAVKTLMEVLDFIVTLLFIIEMSLKIIALGAFMHKGSYARDEWNLLDGFLVIMSLVGLIMNPPFSTTEGTGDKNTLRALRSLRALRGLRPLRVVRRFPGLKLVVNSIIAAVPKIANVVFVTLFFLIIFAIIGVQNFKGQLNFCNDESIDSMEECVGNFFLTDGDCAMLPSPAEENACYISPNGTAFPRLWTPLPYNFNNIVNGFITVFEITSGEMWPDIMYSVVDTAGINQPPIRENKPFAAALFIVMILTCSFLMFNVFVGVVIDNFNKMKDRQEGMDLLTDSQRKWRQTMLHTMQMDPMTVLRPPLNAGPFRLKIFNLVESKKFEIFIISAIMVNVIIMAMRYDDMPDSMAQILYFGNLFFVILFTIEAVLKIYGIGPVRYIQQGWNQFDFTLVVTSYIGLSIGPSMGSITSLFRIVRTARLFRLIKMSKGLTALFQTLLVALPQVTNVMTLLLLVFFIFAVMGMNLFSSIRFNGGLNEHANFTSFGKSMLMLFRMATGESYNEIMHNLRLQPPYCDDKVLNNCGDFVIPIVYCISFFILSSFVLLNLLIAIVIEAFTTISELDLATVKPAHLLKFKAVWAKYDPDGDSMVPTNALLDLLSEVEYPLGLVNQPHTPPMTPGMLKKRVERLFLEKRKNGGFVLPILHHPPYGEANFHEFLTALVNRAMGDTGEGGATETVKEQMETTLRRRTTKTYVNNVRSVTPQKKRKSKAEIADELHGLRRVYVGEVLAVKRIQKHYRKFKSNRRRQHIKEERSNFRLDDNLDSPTNVNSN